MKISVTSGYSRSLHAIGLITLLHRRGHHVGLCLNVKTLNTRRFLVYFRQHGTKVFSLFRRRMMRNTDSSQQHPEVRYADEYLRKHGVANRSMAAACKEVHAKLVNVSDLNSPRALEALDQFAPELIIYAGGGILRQPFLDRASLGVLNAHGGPLPEIRGMNAAEWALFHGMQPGTTVHFVDRGVDTGPILFFQPQDVAPTDTIADVRGKGVVGAMENLLRGVDLISGGATRADTKSQCKTDGKQYFNMHPLLLGIVESRMHRALTPQPRPLNDQHIQ